MTKKTASPYAVVEVLACIYERPSPTNKAAYTKLRVHIRLFLPKWSRSQTVGKVDTMLTRPTMTVPRLGRNPTLLMIVLE